MALFELRDTKLSALERISFPQAGIREREHIQQALVHNISALLDGVLVIGDEQNLWLEANRRVDLLCIDRKANLVIVELKRDDSGSTAELQAIRYTAMLSTMTFSELCGIHSKYCTSKGHDVSPNEAEDLIRSFLGWGDEGEEEDFNSDPKIVLVSGDFSKELTSTVLWLNSRGLDISCVRLVAYQNVEQILVDVQRVIPVPEVEDYQVKLRRREEEKAEARRYKRDYTRYIWRGNTFAKNQLAHAVILNWVQENKPKNLSEVLAAFPISNQAYMIASLEDARKVVDRGHRPRHYLDAEQVLITDDGNRHCVSRGWNINTITEFISVAHELGYEIAEALE